METQVLTPLGESLIFAGKRLSVRPERRKVLFCLTDGKPVIGCRDENVTMEHAKQTVSLLVKSGIEVVGIGVMEMCVSEVFPDYAVIHRLEDLPKVFMKELTLILDKNRRKNG